MMCSFGFFGCKKKKLTYGLLYYKNNTKMNHRATFFYLINIYDEFISIDVIDTYLLTISFLSFQQEEE
jgi:hypothetical protein